MYVRIITQRMNGTITKPDGRGYMEMLVNDINRKHSSTTPEEEENVLRLRNT